MNTPTHFLFFVVPVVAPVAQAYQATERSARLTRSSGIALGVRERPHRETRAERLAREDRALGLIPARKDHAMRRTDRT
jgi:hypothetical protein